MQTARQHSTVSGLTNVTVAYDEHTKKKYYTKAEELKKCSWEIQEKKDLCSDRRLSLPMHLQLSSHEVTEVMEQTNVRNSTE